MDYDRTGPTLGFPCYQPGKARCLLERYIGQADVSTHAGIDRILASLSVLGSGGHNLEKTLEACIQARAN